MIKMEVLLLLVALLCLLALSCLAVDPSCECLVFSGTFGRSYGTFRSPGFPHPYPPDIHCLLYTFIAGHDEVIRLDFIHFDVFSPNPGCSEGDTVTVYKSPGPGGGVNEASEPAGQLCGQTVTTLYSDGPSIVLQFHSDTNPRNSTGFQGTFRFIPAGGYRSQGEPVPGTACDYTFFSSTASPNATWGKFFSPSYPSSYPRHSRCAYIFRGRPGERVKVIFEEVDLQLGDISCLDREDVIKVHEGGSALSPVISVLCNQVSRSEVVSSSHQLFIELATSSYWPGHGFTASFFFEALESKTEVPKQDIGPAVSATRWNCEVTVRSEYRRSGVVTSPGYPGPVVAGGGCRILFSGAGKERLRLRISHLAPSKPGRCSPALRILDLVEGRRRPLGPCKTGSSLMSSGHRLELLTGGNNTLFRAEYVFLTDFGIKTGRQLSEYPCAFKYSAEHALSGSFHSPNFPGPYPRATECHYFFHAARGHRIRIHFSYFDVEGVTPCDMSTRSDYVEFFDFPDRPPVRHCGQLEPFDVLLERRFFRVTFRSNQLPGRGTGFNATYQFLGYPRPAHRGLLPVASAAHRLLNVAAAIGI